MNSVTDAYIGSSSAASECARLEMGQNIDIDTGYCIAFGYVIYLVIYLVQPHWQVSNQ